jgi:hypothetical protein
MPIIASTTLMIKVASTSHSQPFPERLSQSVQWQKWTKKHIPLENPDFPAEDKFFADINPDYYPPSIFARKQGYSPKPSPPQEGRAYENKDIQAKKNIPRNPDRIHRSKKNNQTHRRMEQWIANHKKHNK